jgi:hypothetical protein
VELDLFHATVPGDSLARRLASSVRDWVRARSKDGIGTVQGERLELASRAARSNTLVADTHTHTHTPIGRAVPESTEIALSSTPTDVGVSLGSSEG